MEQWLPAILFMDQVPMFFSGLQSPTVCKINSQFLIHILLFALQTLQECFAQYWTSDRTAHNSKRNKLVRSLKQTTNLCHHILSCRVNLMMHAKYQLPKYPGSAVKVCVVVLVLKHCMCFELTFQTYVPNFSHSWGNKNLRLCDTGIKNTHWRTLWIFSNTIT